MSAPNKSAFTWNTVSHGKKNVKFNHKAKPTKVQPKEEHKDKPMPDLSAWEPKEDVSPWIPLETIKEEPDFSWGAQLPKCDTFERSYEYAKTLDPTAVLNYIPVASREKCKWVGDKTLQHPSLGKLLWTGSEPPKDFQTMKATKFYVCRGNVGATVEAVVKASPVDHQDNLSMWTANADSEGWMVSITTARTWANNKVEEWKKKVPNELGGYVEDLSAEDVYTLILNREMSEKDLNDWLEHEVNKGINRKEMITLSTKKEDAKIKLRWAETLMATHQSKYGWKLSPYKGWVPPIVLNKRKQQKRCLKCGHRGHRKAQCKEIFYQMEEKDKGKPLQQPPTPNTSPSFQSFSFSLPPPGLENSLPGMHVLNFC